LAIAAMTLVAGVTALLYKRVKRNLGYISIAALAFVVMGGGYAFIGYADNLSLVVIGLVVAGLGAGLLMPNANVWATSVAPAVTRGRALGGLTAALFLGQFLSPLVVQPLTAASSLSMTFVIVGLVSVVIAVCFLVITRVNERERRP
jgi:MFS family permease